jgi:hypothetical protein
MARGMNTSYRTGRQQKVRQHRVNGYPYYLLAMSQIDQICVNFVYDIICVYYVPSLTHSLTHRIHSSHRILTQVALEIN